ncbi:MAG TPA: hypothetical protein VJT32_06900 [bacterium]|nr:hypothetical protein [bacterium]
MVDRAPGTLQDDPVLTTQEAAAMLKISTRSLLDSDAPWFPAGAGAMRPHRRYLRSALLDWARARQVTEPV